MLPSETQFGLGVDKRTIPIAIPSLGLEEWESLRGPLESGWLTHGPKVTAFEKAFAARHEVKHALAATSCTTALHLILAALEIGPGDEVIVPAFTWVATANVVLYCGATPVFVDVDMLTFNINPAQLRAKITPKTKAILVVHLFGLCADMDNILEASGSIPVIEDAACAVGSVYKGRPAGSLGLAGAFSFHPRKSITTGEGGMVTTDDDALAEKINMLRNHGASISEEQRHHGSQPYILPDFNLIGFNYRMTDLQGAVGLVQLGRLDGFLADRSHWAAYYQERLSDITWLRTPVVPDGYRHGWQSFVCQVDPEEAPMPRNDIMKFLQEQGISTRPGTHAVHTLAFYQKRFGYRPEDYSMASRSEKQSIAIPLHNRMSPEDYEYVVQALHSVDRS